MARLIIIRHAESKYNLENRIQGHLDSKLTPKGIRQAKSLARRIFKEFKIDVIYSSDLARAYSTTEEIVKRTRLKIVRLPQLREIFLGDWEGMTPEEVDRLYENGYQKWLKKPTGCHIPKSEKISHFQKRITRCVEKIAKDNQGKNVLIVTHGGAITALLSFWLKADIDHLMLNLQIDNTSITVVEKTKHKTRLMRINDASHVSKKDK